MGATKRCYKFSAILHWARGRECEIMMGRAKFYLSLRTSVRSQELALWMQQIHMQFLLDGKCEVSVSLMCGSWWPTHLRKDQFYSLAIPSPRLELSSQERILERRSWEKASWRRVKLVLHGYVSLLISLLAFWYRGDMCRDFLSKQSFYWGWRDSVQDSCFICGWPWYSPWHFILPPESLRSNFWAHIQE